ncbi:hypothetical protein TNIN_181571 [Trichonephila inaurata madagascariensis]|uniref:Uncharacterized protein n=1 Tax=Trichonephila inaurata madagascariensis TaxID=2747483 RepID=A0A8X6XX90_9ARAC|nr:hypothetical protein TNIN_181571 [Trichonephila inaurata madagascariensis]
MICTAPLLAAPNSHESSQDSLVSYSQFWFLIFKTFTMEQTQKSSLDKAESPLDFLFELWNEENQAIRIERLTSLERLHNYIVPRIPDAEPLLPTRNKMNMSIRMLCLRINVNLIHRILLHIAIFFNSKLDGIIRAVLGLVEYTSTNPSEAKLESGVEIESTSEDPQLALQ